MYLLCFLCLCNLFIPFVMQKYLVIKWLEMFKIFCAHLQIDRIVIIRIYFQLSYSVATNIVLHIAIISKDIVQNLKVLKSYVALVNIKLCTIIL